MKERTSVSLDKEKAEYLQQPHVNASGLVNELLDEYLGGDADQLLQLRQQQLESEIDELESRLETKQKELTHVESLLEEQAESVDMLFEDAAESLQHTPRDPENPAIETWAEKLDCTPEELIERLEARDE